MSAYGSVEKWRGGPYAGYLNDGSSGGGGATVEFQVNGAPAAGVDKLNIATGDGITAAVVGDTITISGTEPVPVEIEQVTTQPTSVTGVANILSSIEVQETTLGALHIYRIFFVLNYSGNGGATWTWEGATIPHQLSLKTSLMVTNDISPHILVLSADGTITVSGAGLFGIIYAQATVAVGEV